MWVIIRVCMAASVGGTYVDGVVWVFSGGILKGLIWAEESAVLFVIFELLGRLEGWEVASQGHVYLI
jgi:hypothetical protein